MPKSGIEALGLEFREDPTFAWAWYCNLVMMAYDAGAPLPLARQGATTFMRVNFDVDMSTCSEWNDMMDEFGEVTLKTYTFLLKCEVYGRVSDLIKSCPTGCTISDGVVSHYYNIVAGSIGAAINNLLRYKEELSLKGMQWQVSSDFTIDDELHSITELAAIQYGLEFIDIKS